MNDYTFRRKFKALFLSQYNFQKKVGINVDTKDFENKKDIAEGFLLMLMKEVVEVSKTLPSHFNKFEKHPPEYSREEFLKEIADVVLVAINLTLLENVTTEEFLEIVEEVQYNNFRKLEDKLNAT